jgi:thiol-disulfide isomerase/thioredoxin
MFGKIHAPDFGKLRVDFVNTAPFNLEDLKGNVILIDFWTYCCINCIRTVPDLQVVEEHFKNDPVAVLGVHYAKFDNENNTANIENAINRYGIEHPILRDSFGDVWDNYAVRAWPTLMLVDSEGYIRKGYSGEGHREEFLRDIADLLKEGEKNHTLGQKYAFTFTSKPEPPLLYYPGKVSIDGDRIAIANGGRNTILLGEVSDAGIHITQTIGSGKKGNADGAFSEASFTQPQGVCLTGDTIYVADTGNNIIRKIDLITQSVSTLEIPSLRSPWDVAVKGTGLYIALAGSHQIGKYDLATNMYSIFAGSGYEDIEDGPARDATLAQTSGLSIFGDQMYFADSETSSIRYVGLLEPSVVRTIVGHGLFVFGLQDGAVDQALFQHPLGVCASGDNIYVADTYNSAIRLIDISKGVVSTLISTMGHEVCRIDDKECQVLGLNEPSDIKIWKQSLIISDTNNHLIREYNFDTKELSILQITT